VLALVNDGNLTVSLREQFGRVLADQPLDSARDGLLAALIAAPERLQVKLAEAMAGNRAGAELLLGAVEAGRLPPRLLLDRGVKDRLLAAKADRGQERLTALTKDVSAPDAALTRLVEDRRKQYSSAGVALDTGKELFVKNCAACHQIGGEGALIGPQLDGIGNRGLERLSEDLLDPNRNVDRAFRSTLLILKDGDVVSGLFRREEGELLVLAESTGKEVTVPKATVESRRESETSLMPENFGELLTQEQFNQLMTYLLSQRGK